MRPNRHVSCNRLVGMGHRSLAGAMMTSTVFRSAPGLGSQIMPAPFSCDTSVALGSATVDGSTIFAKNSDRPVNEAQPLIHVPRTELAPGSTVDCQYIAIPQVEMTW